MKKCLSFIFLFLFSASFIFHACAAENNKSDFALAPAFQLNDLNGKAVSLSGYLGKKTVLLVFWTTWCPYCREQLKDLNERYPWLAKKSIEVLAINTGEPKDKVAGFAKSRSLTFKILLDEDNQVAASYDLMGVPTYFVVDISGKIVSAGNYFPEDMIK